MEMKCNFINVDVVLINGMECTDKNDEAILSHLFCLVIRVK